MDNPSELPDDYARSLDEALARRGQPEALPDELAGLAAEPPEAVADRLVAERARAAAGRGV